MNELEQELGYQKQELKALHYRFAKRLSHIGKGDLDKRLVIINKSEGTYYAERWPVDGKEKTRYLGTDSAPAVQIIKERRFLDKSLRILKEKITFIESATSSLEAFDAEEVNASLPKAYRLAPEHLKEVVGPDEAERWYHQAVKEKERLDNRYGISHPERLRHFAKDGTMMRSKSEVIIGNELIDSGVLFIYELPVWVGGVLLHPDFAFYSRRKRRIVYLEHFGMLNDEEYLQTFKNKVDIYIRGGLIPCVDVIFTFDFEDGVLDARMISNIISEYC